MVEPRPTRPLRVAIVGSRGYPHLDQVAAFVARLAKWSSRTGRPVTIISGTDPDRSGRDGVDQEAIRSARHHGLTTIVHEADWDRHGRAAGPLRNTTIVEEADYVVGFWSLCSRGTCDVLSKALRAGKLEKVYGPDGTEVEMATVGEALRAMGR